MAINLNQFVEDFKYLDPKDPGTWPAVPKLVALIAILAGILVGAFFLDTQGQIDELEAGKTQEAKLKEDYINKKKQSVNLDLHKQQLREIDQSFGALLKQLPNRAQMDALLVDINQAGLGRGLQFELFRPASGESAKEFYSELPIQVRVLGNYHDMGAFASDLGQLSRIVTLNDVTIGPGKDGQLQMDATARTFRYLDDEEVSAQVGQSRQGAEEMRFRDMRLFFLVLAALALAACGGEQYGDLKQELAQLSKDLRGRVDPLPQVKPYEPVPYKAFEEVDPFKSSRIEVVATGAAMAGASGIKPDMNRAKEPLEAFPVESLRMVGTLQQDKQTFGLVRAGSNLFRVKKGNYMGLNFGVITAIDENEIKLKELVQDGSGDWVERVSSLQLVEAQR